jgi:hypothetical protein
MLNVTLPTVEEGRQKRILIVHSSSIHGREYKYVKSPDFLAVTYSSPAPSISVITPP